MDIVWENKQENLRKVHEKLKALCGMTDIVILPETFSTGFSMNTPNLAEPTTGETITMLQKWSKEYQFAIVGSYISKEQSNFYNRAFFLTPNGDSYFYDKRHLFRMANEIDHFSSGISRQVISYMGWNIMLLVCYDLRFPVWSRNVNNEYDLLIYVANWPIARRSVWDILLQARAIENISYVCGVNRIGKDNNEINHNGGSAAYSPKGELLTIVPDNEEGIATIELDLSELRKFRIDFPAWKDEDKFTMF
ncbi:amidohydrolase [Histomonas meleagridis]|uniref:amidohydrolase n=1 Tax=Histomonas meleagridis TaxID=135588 RepID=UPI003559EF39|nr:amidohydrolase [Histomonas meleagridis]KAH0798367.1 amidohydrolase [Histomonas meleagridis]